MKKKLSKVLIVLAVVVLVAIAGALKLKKGSELSFEAIVKEVKINGENDVRIIVERTTQIYTESLNSLGISSKTRLFDSNKKEIGISDIEEGSKVLVKAKDAFDEETIFYYPEVYSVTLIDIP
ncbi:MAG: hypothetical protein J5717_11190 [Lachnospiraceae bacterium]|nr:hypothetical protein [Lachnospiraceae bacterium]